jgi:hypothetical protein
LCEVHEAGRDPVKRNIPNPGVVLACLVAMLMVAPVAAKDPLILPHPSLLHAQQLLRQSEQDGAGVMQPGTVLALQEKINAAWSAYHLQVEEKADDPDDKEAIRARHLAEEVELDAELLRVTLRTQDDEARLDSLRASLGLAPAGRPAAPRPAARPGSR